MTSLDIATTSSPHVHENWNRYYDPSTGRYLQIEPLLRQGSYLLADSSRPLPPKMRDLLGPGLSGPGFLADQAKQGRIVPPYAYAMNNPLNLVDRDGNAVGAGTAAGAAAGSAIAPGPGTIIGAIIGTAIFAAGVYCIGSGDCVPATTKEKCEDDEERERNCEKIAYGEFIDCMYTTGSANPALCARHAAAAWMQCMGYRLPRPPDRIWPH